MLSILLIVFIGVVLIHVFFRGEITYIDHIKHVWSSTFAAFFSIAVILVFSDVTSSIKYHGGILKPKIKRGHKNIRKSVALSHKRGVIASATFYVNFSNDCKSSKPKQSWKEPQSSQTLIVEHFWNLPNILHTKFTQFCHILSFVVSHSLLSWTI